MAAVRLGRRFAEDQRWPVEQNSDGICLLPPRCEPFTVAFDKELVIDSNAKTQLGGAAVHMRLIELLRQLSTYVEWEEVFDDAEAWDGATDREVRAAFRSMNLLVRRRAAEAGGKAYQVLADGRIADVVVTGPAPGQWNVVLKALAWACVGIAAMVGVAFAYSWWAGLL